MSDTMPPPAVQRDETRACASRIAWYAQARLDTLCVMHKIRPAWVFGVLLFTGLVLGGSMLLAWVDVETLRVTGLQIARNDNPWLFLVPAAGALLAVLAGTRSPHIRLAALVAGAVAPGYMVFNMARSMAIHAGLDTWLILGGAGLMLFGAGQGRRLWRAVGGIAVLVGFFAPWTGDTSTWHVLIRQRPTHLAERLLWDILFAGGAGVVAAVLPNGGRLAATAGGAIYGTALFLLGTMMWQVFGVGAWLALGASVVALVVGALTRARS
jgi:hypothetical protein